MEIVLHSDGCLESNTRSTRPPRSLARSGLELDPCQRFTPFLVLPINASSTTKNNRNNGNPSPTIPPPRSPAQPQVHVRLRVFRRPRGHCLPRYRAQAGYHRRAHWHGRVSRSAPDLCVLWLVRAVAGPSFALSVCRRCTCGSFSSFWRYWRRRYDAWRHRYDQQLLSVKPS